MRNNSFPLIIWVDHLSIFSLPKIIALSFRDSGAVVRFITTSTIAYAVIKCVRFFGIIPMKIEKVTYSLGDMDFRNSTSTLGTEIMFAHPEMAYKTLQIIKRDRLYQALCQFLPEEKLDVFFEMKISEKVYPIARLLLIARWNKEQKVQQETKDIILCSDCGLVAPLKQILADDSISLIPHKSIDVKNFIKRRFKFLIHFKEILTSFDRIHAMKAKKNLLGPYPASRFMLAVHCQHTDINLKKRSDFYWFPLSRIDPQRILLFFDETSPRPISKRTYREIGRLGIKWKWVARRMKSSVTSGNSWRGPEKIADYDLNSKMRIIKGKAQSLSDSWISLVAENLIEEIQRWLVFFRASNTRIVVNVGVQSSEFIAQSIALDFIDGIRIGVQRTRISITEYQPFLRYNANHVFFVWGKEVNNHKGTSKAIENLIISGFPFDSAFDKGSLRENSPNKLVNERVKLVIALFDLAYGRDTFVSENMLAAFYRGFLEWLIDDKEIAVILKEKRLKPSYELIDIQNLMVAAEKTGRFIRVKNPLGRFAADASFAADITVGLGLATPVTEAVITGCRGIHCDLPKFHFHYFYQWGDKKLIFDDIDALISALKRYKENPDNAPELGDWAAYIDELDPFRDGKGGERIGTYMRWLLESFDKGKGRDEAILEANKLYAEAWGEDKIIDMRKRHEIAQYNR